MSSMLDLLMRPDTPNVKATRPTAEYEVKRLSEIYGEPFVMKLQGLSFDRINELRDADDMTIQTVLEGVVDPNLRDARLNEAFGAPTPAEALKTLFLPGEIDALQIAIERLSGYRGSAIEEVRKNSETEMTDA